MRFGRFLYSDEARTNGGGDTGTTTTPVAPESLLTADQLKSYGIENVDQLQTILRQHKESSIPVEEKQRQEESRKADLIKFSVENGLAKVDDFNQAESIKSKADRDLVYEKYDREWREDNPDITDPDEISANVKKDFESEYKLDSENKKAKTRGESRLSKEATELRNPHLNKITSAEKAYTERKAMEGKIPEFNKFIETLVEKLTPEKLVVSKVKDGEQEVPIEVELSKEERKELAKVFRTPKAFAAFTSAEDPKKLEEALSKKMNGYLKEKYFDTAIGKTYEKAKAVGLASGSTVGATQPFAIVKGGQSPNNGVRDTNVMKEIRESHQRVADKHR